MEPRPRQSKLPDGIDDDGYRRIRRLMRAAVQRTWRANSEVIAVVPRGWEETVVHRLNEFDFFLPDHPEFSDRTDIAFRLDDELVDAKVEAVRAHESQMGLLFEAYGEDFFRSILSTEVYRPGVRSSFRSRVLQEIRQG